MNRRSFLKSAFAACVAVATFTAKPVKAAAKVVRGWIIGNTGDGIAGESIFAGCLLRRGEDGKLYQCTAHGYSWEAAGFALHDTPAGKPVKLAVSGVIDGLSPPINS